MSPSAFAALALGTFFCVLGFYHLVFVAPTLRKLRQSSSRVDAERGAEGAAAMLEQGEIEARLAKLERSARREMPRIGFVRYNAFDDVAGDLSYALALVNAEGDGVLLSSLFSREETRTFGKRVRKFLTEQDASKEERDAIALARTGMEIG